MKNWIYFNGIMINRNHITFIKKIHEHNIIDIGGIHFSFNQKFDTNEEMEAEYESLSLELGIEETV